MNNLDQTQHDPESELKARIQATLAHASACSKACEGMFDPVAEVARLKALAGLTDEMESCLAAFAGYSQSLTERESWRQALQSYILEADSLLARVRAVKGNKP